MAEVVLDGVWKRYPGDVVAVRDFDLHIADGELMVLVGPSGCGKSTTLRMVAGLEEITEGELRIGGRRVNEVHPKDRDIAMVFQNYALYPHMTVRENMAFGLKIRRMPKAEIGQRVANAASILGISELLARKPKALSGGQRQRVAMGRALVREPAVFLFDEPLSNLDAKLRVQMRAEIARLHRELQTTMVYVTHDQVEAMTLADRICVMDQGLLQQVGTPLEVYNQPANQFVAGFIGSPGMNFVGGMVVDGPDGAELEAGGFRIPFGPRQRARLKALGTLGGGLTLGVRPRAMSPSDGEGHIRGRVDYFELMGAETFVHLHTPAGVVVARLPGTFPVEVGQTLAMDVDGSKLHLFDASGTNVLQGCIDVTDTPRRAEQAGAPA